MNKMEIKQTSTLTWLVPIIAILAAIIAGVGLFSQGVDGPFTFTTIYGNEVEIYGQGIYQHDSIFVATLSKEILWITQSVGDI